MNNKGETCVRNWIVRLTFYLCGIMIVTFGVSLTIRSNLGAGGWDSTAVGLSELSGLTVGNWVYIIGAVIITLNAILTRGKPNVKAFLTIFLMGTMVDVWLLKILTFSTPEHLGIRFMILLPGIFLIAFGITTYTRGRIANHPIDDLMIILTKITRLSLRSSRLSCEIFSIILALCVGGPVSIGTFIIAFFIGPFIQWLYKPIENVFIRLAAWQDDHLKTI